MKFEVNTHTTTTTTFTCECGEKQYPYRTNRGEWDDDFLWEDPVDFNDNLPRFHCEGTWKVTCDRVWEFNFKEETAEMVGYWCMQCGSGHVADVIHPTKQKCSVALRKEITYLQSRVQFSVSQLEEAKENLHLAWKYYNRMVDK